MQYENKIKQIDQLKIQIDRHRPLSQKKTKKMKEYYRVGLTYSSNALEGNSLTESETKVVIEEGITIGGKPIRDHYEAVGHSEAYSLLFELAKHKRITEKDVLELHKLFFYRIDRDRAGQYRKEQVFISGSSFIPPSPKQVLALMKKFIADLPRLKEKHHPVELAALAHLRFVTIHPFVDGNGRAARLLMNLALLQTGYTITIIPRALRSEYMAAIKKSQVGSKNERPFVNFISNMVVESMNEYLRLSSAFESSSF